MMIAAILWRDGCDEYDALLLVEGGVGRMKLSAMKDTPLFHK